jgi:signal transduction histidine kinase
MIAAFMFVFLSVLIASTVSLYRRAERHLDNELGERLAAVAGGLAHATRFSSPDSLSFEAIDEELFTLLWRVMDEDGLSNVVILTPDGLTVVDLGGFSEPGEENPFIDLDFSAVTLARSGIPAYTNLYKTGDVYMKSAYAPIQSSNDEIVGIVGVEAGASFFTDLRELSSVIVSILAAGVVVVIVLGLLLYRQTAALDRAQETIIRRENLATMGRMVANIAHDIRNPLSIIKTSAQRLSRKYDTDDEVLTYISEEVDELNRVLTSYLDFAGSQKPAALEPAPTEGIIRRCMLVVEPELKAKRITLEHRAPSEAVVVRVAEKRAQQAVMNVLMNAVQAVDEGGLIRISQLERESYGIIAIEDDGRGIAEKDLNEITKPFFTNRADGSGLGLSIVKTIMDEHDGRLAIESRPGAGTTVELFFPLAE